MITWATAVTEGSCSRQVRRGLHAALITSSLAALLMLASPLLPLASAAREVQAQRKETAYYCVMHPDVKSKRAGKCPKCGMALRKAEGQDSPQQSNTNGKPTLAGEAVKSMRMPDTAVYDQDGRRLRFYSDLVRGKTVAINFIFTTCTTICPPLTATFRKVQQTLGESAGRYVSLISISVDPVTDVPERLKSFAAKFNAGPGWKFVTGSKPDIDALLRSLGALAGDKNDHTPMVLVGNEAAGYWTRTYGLAPAATIVGAINDASSRSQSAGAEAQVPMPAPAQSSPHDAGAQAQKSKTAAEAAAFYFTNTELVTQDNKTLRFYEDLLKGKTVVMNFMFTTCTGVCPPMTANLKKVQDLLGDRVGRDISLVSFSVDPLVDTPDVLKKYAGSFKAGPGWYFLTGRKENVGLVLRKLGGYVEDKNQHNSILIIGNVETGEWMKMLAMSKPAQIADAVMKIADGK